MAKTGNPTAQRKQLTQIKGQPILALVADSAARSAVLAHFTADLNTFARKLNRLR